FTLSNKKDRFCGLFYCFYFSPFGEDRDESEKITLPLIKRDKRRIHYQNNSDISLNPPILPLKKGGVLFSI
ncbi:hypothetical protein L0O74_14420, partial [Bifidobacterium longum]|nr:hypothetical protein [Bifidobacterium longum]